MPLPQEIRKLYSEASKRTQRQLEIARTAQAEYGSSHQKTLVAQRALFKAQEGVWLDQILLLKKKRAHQRQTRKPTVKTERMLDACKGRMAVLEETLSRIDNDLAQLSVINPNQ